MSSNQSEEQEKKNDTSNHNRERCFFKCEKNDTSNQKPQRCEFRAKIQREKTIIKYSFSRRKVKNILEIGLE